MVFNINRNNQTMIDKQTAHMIAGNNYRLVDKEGNIWKIICCWDDCFFLDDEENEVHDEPYFNQIGTDYFILARELDLTKEITVDGETFQPLKRLLWEYNFNTDVMQESEILEYAESMVEIDMSVTVSKFLSKWHFSHDLPEGSWKPLDD